MPLWLGIVGFIVSLLSLGLSGVAFWRSVRVKKLDLRIELRKLIAALHDDLRKMPDRFAAAKKSRHAISATRGMSQSGALQAWNAAHDADLEEVNALAKMLPSADESFADASEKVLEDQLVTLSNVRRRSDALKAKCDASLADDRRNVDYLRQARMASPIRSPFGPPADG